MQSSPENRKGAFLNLLYEANITPIPKPDKLSMKRENYRSISLLNRQKNPQQNINRIPRYIKIIVFHNQIVLIPKRIKYSKSINVIYHLDRLKKKITYIDVEKILDKIHHSFKIIKKKAKKNRNKIQVNTLKFIENINKTQQLTSCLMFSSLSKCFPPKVRNKTCSLSPILRWCRTSSESY